MLRRVHRVLGLVLLLPMLGWVVTGFVFFTKPGYDAAYASLRIKCYPLDHWQAPPGRSDWLEMRAVRTVLGDHLLVRTATGSAHIDPATGSDRPLPDEAALTRMLEEAIDSSRERYGSIASVERRQDEAPGATARTTTGAAIDLDWATLRLSQSGRDTRLIDNLYRIHYLQWTGIRAVDRVLGVAGLLALLGLSGLGARLAFGRRPRAAR